MGNPYLSNARAIPQGGEFRSAWSHGWFWDQKKKKVWRFLAHKHVFLKEQDQIKVDLKWATRTLSPNARATPQGGEFRSAWSHGWFWEFRTNRTREFPGMQTRGVEQNRCLCFGIDGLWVRACAAAAAQVFSHRQCQCCWMGCTVGIRVRVGGWYR